MDSSILESWAQCLVASLTPLFSFHTPTPRGLQDCNTVRGPASLVSRHINRMKRYMSTSSGQVLEYWLRNSIDKLLAAPICCRYPGSSSSDQQKGHACTRDNASAHDPEERWKEMRQEEGLQRGMAFAAVVHKRRHKPKPSSVAWCRCNARGKTGQCVRRRKVLRATLNSAFGAHSAAATADHPFVAVAPFFFAFFLVTLYGV